MEIKRNHVSYEKINQKKRDKKRQRTNEKI